MKFIDTRRCFTFENLQFHIFSGYDAIFAKHVFHSFPCQFWMVVFFAKVTQPHVLQSLLHIFSNCHTAISVAQVPRLTQYSLLEVLWICPMS